MASARWIRKVARSKLLLRTRNRFRGCGQVPGFRRWWDGSPIRLFRHSTTFSVICGWNNRCRVPVFSGIGPRLKKNTAPFRYARVLPRLEKHRYEIRILVFIRVLLDELRCSIRRTREFHRDDAKETLFLRFEAARGRRFLWFRSPLSLIIDNISKCVSSCVIFTNIAITERYVRSSYASSSSSFLFLFLFSSPPVGNSMFLFIWKYKLIRT